MKIESIGWSRAISQWELKHDTRVAVEEKYRDYTGTIDIMELHIPYTRTDIVMKAFRRSVPGRRMLVFAGDSLNLDMFSRFYKRSTKEHKPSQQLDMMVEVMRCAQGYYDDIIYMATNHENRYEKIILDNIADKEIAEEILKQMTSIKEYFEEKKVNVQYVGNYLAMVGDILICHTENNSSVPGSLSRDLVSYYVPRINKSISVIVQAHTHCQSMVPVDRVLTIESGACIDSLDYWRDGKMKGKRKMSSIGYAECVINKGKADIDKCHPRIMGWEGYL